MEGELLIKDRCLDMFLYALRLAYENNIDEADKVLHDLEARHHMSYIFMKHAMNEILGKHSNVSKSCAEKRSNKMDENDELYCPIRKSSCAGKKCIFAVKIDNPFRDPYVNYYICGLVNICDHGTPKYIDQEFRNDD